MLMTQNYFFTTRLARLVVVGLILTIAGAAMSACSGFAGPAGEREDTDVAPEASILYQATLAVYAAEGMSVELASEDLFLVSSKYEEIEPGLRRRVITRVMTFGRNVALNVAVEYQHRDTDAAEPTWQTVVADKALSERARREEAALGRAIERQFHQIK